MPIVHAEPDRDVFVITISNPPVNAAPEVWRGLLQAIAALEARSDRHHSGRWGTQRVSPCVVARTIQMVCAGDRITSGKALELCLIDKVMSSKLLAAAIDYA